MIKHIVYIMAFLFFTPFAVVAAYKNPIKSIHVFVALCDNKYQKIVKVPARIGNGQDPNSNMYWGAKFGVRAYFRRSKEWKLLKTEKISNTVLERLIFKNVRNNYYLVADAYDGRYIKQTTIDFLKSCAGQLKTTVKVENQSIGVNGNADLLAYIGHDGLMNFQLSNSFDNVDGIKRDCIILACISKTYFNPYLNKTKAVPLVWTTGLMCPEAYTLHNAISGYVNNEASEVIRSRAAIAYNKYQKCGKSFADKLLVSGW